MKTMIAILAGAVLLAGPAFAGVSTPKEREATRQLNLEAAQQAKSTNQQIAANLSQSTQTSAQAESPPAAAPTTPVETAPNPSPSENAGQSQNTASPAQ